MWLENSTRLSRQISDIFPLCHDEWLQSKSWRELVEFFVVYFSNVAYSATFTYSAFNWIYAKKKFYVQGPPGPGGPPGDLGKVGPPVSNLCVLSKFLYYCVDIFRHTYLKKVINLYVSQFHYKILQRCWCRKKFKYSKIWGSVLSTGNCM